MRLSSISSSRVAQVRWRLPGWPVYLLILVIVSELVLRSPVVTNLLPRPELTLWQAPNVQTKIDYWRNLAATQSADVLFIGDSTVLAGINPQVFDAAQSKQGSQSLGAFNGALEGLPAYGVLTFVQVYTQYAKPKTIVYGMIPRALNDNSPSVRDVSDKIHQSPLAIAATERSVQGWLLSNLLQHSSLYRYRWVLHQLLLSGGTLPEQPKIYFDQHGYVSSEGRLSEASPAKRQSYFTNDGVVNYAGRGKQTQALQDLITYCKENGIQLVLVNMPVTQDYANTYYTPDVYNSYLSTLGELTTAYGVPFWNLESLSANSHFDDTSFEDLIHLNRFGADKLSTLLAQRYVELTNSQAQAINR